MMNHCLSASAGRVQVQGGVAGGGLETGHPCFTTAGLGWAGLERADVMFAAFC